MTSHPDRLTHLERLEAESIHIMREVAAECEKPVMLYSIGKDSAVMLHLAIKAFYPVEAALPADACRYRLEVPRHVCHARSDRGEVRLGTASSTRIPKAWPRTSIPSTTARSFTPTS